MERHYVQGEKEEVGSFNPLQMLRVLRLLLIQLRHLLYAVMCSLCVMCYGEEYWEISRQINKRQQDNGQINLSQENHLMEYPVLKEISVFFLYFCFLY